MQPRVAAWKLLFTYSPPKHRAEQSAGCVFCNNEVGRAVYASLGSPTSFLKDYSSRLLADHDQPVSNVMLLQQKRESANAVLGFVDKSRQVMILGVRGTLVQSFKCMYTFGV